MPQPESFISELLSIETQFKISATYYYPSHLSSSDVCGNV